MSLASIGWGSEFSLHNGTALTELDEVTEINFPEFESEEIEVTHLKSPGRKREYIAGMSDGGEFDVTMNYIPGSTTDLLCQAAEAAKDVRQWEIGVSAADGTIERAIAGTGFVKKYARNGLSPDGVKQAVLTIKVSGNVTEAAAP